MLSTGLTPHELHSRDSAPPASDDSTRHGARTGDPGHVRHTDARPERQSRMSNARPLSLSTTIVASEQQISCDVADEVVLLSVQNGQYYGLNPVAASIWRLIQKPRTLAEVQAGLLAEYDDVSPETCALEVLAFATNMLSLGLIQTI
jgi:hypothetical protein